MIHIRYRLRQNALDLQEQVERQNRGVEDLQQIYQEERFRFELRFPEWKVTTVSLGHTAQHLDRLQTPLDQFHTDPGLPCLLLEHHWST